VNLFHVEEFLIAAGNLAMPNGGRSLACIPEAKSEFRRQGGPESDRGRLTSNSEVDRGKVD
jgi:hypothetical protein